MSLISPPSTLPPGATVWAYLRDSGGEGQDRSVERQLNSIRQYANQHGLILTRIYKDIAKTGTTTAGREDFHKMIAASKKEKDRPNGLLLWNYARFGRNTDEAIYYKATLRQRGIIIHSLTDPIPEGPYARLIETMIETANEEKSRQTSVDVKESLRTLVLQGAVPGKPPRGIKRTPIQTTNPRTGKQRTNHRWDPDPEYTHRIQKAYQMLVHGKTLKEISEQTRLYKSDNTYITFYQNPIYKGELHYADIIIKNYCEPIVNPELWDKANAIIKERKQAGMLKSKTTHPRTKRASYLLTGLLHCHKCGAALVGYTSSGQKNGKPYRRYTCSRAKSRRDCSMKPIPAEHLENTVLTNTKEFLGDPDNLYDMMRTMYTDTAATNEETEKALESLNAELGSTKRQLDRIASAIAAAGHNPTLLEKLEELEKTKTHLLSEISQNTEKKQAWPLPPVTYEMAEAQAKTLASLLRRKDRTLLRKVMLGIIHKITVDRNDKELTFFIIFYHKKKDDLKTASIIRRPVGVPIYRRSFVFTAKVKPKYVYERKKST